MKKFFCLILTAAVMLSLSACGFTDLYSQPATLNTVANSSQKNEIVLNSYMVELYSGETFQLSDTTDVEKELNWASTNEAVAIVNSNGLVTAVAPGVANITCSANGAQSVTCTVNVKTVLTINLDKVTLKKGSTYQLYATSASATWTSSNGSVATVNATGLVTAVNTGVATITCTVGSQTVTCTVTVQTGDTGVTQPVSDQIFPNSSVSYLTSAEALAKLQSMTGYSPTGSYRQDAINEIYARNGYVFQNTTIAAYYQGKSWYTPNPSFTAAQLNSVEQANIKLLQDLY